MRYTIVLHRKVINEFETFKAADYWVRAYNKLNNGTHTGAIVQPRKTA